MLAPNRVEQIQRMLAEGRLSQRAIARTLGVSRDRVDAIANGRRRDYAARDRVCSIGEEASAVRVERCPGCGALVHMPCLACHLRALQRRRKLPM